MQRTTAIIRDGRVELNEPVDWPDGTEVEVIPLPGPTAGVNWLDLPPLEVGEFREAGPDDDLYDRRAMMPLWRREF